MARDGWALPAGSELEPTPQESSAVLDSGSCPWLGTKRGRGQMVYLSRRESKPGNWGPSGCKALEEDSARLAAPGQGPRTDQGWGEGPRSWLAA